MIPAEEQAQRRAALRALLAKPLLVADTDSEALAGVRRHLTELREWLNRETGRRLTADSETARLFKTSTNLSDASHPARGTTRSRSADAVISYCVRPCRHWPEPTRSPRSAASPTTC